MVLKVVDEGYRGEQQGGWRICSVCEHNRGVSALGMELWSYSYDVVLGTSDFVHGTDTTMYCGRAIGCCIPVLVSQNKPPT